MTKNPSTMPGIYLWSSLLICVLYFIIFIRPNSVASENIKMVAVFEPDESVPLPYVFNMIKPAETVKQALINFAFYEYYFYGFPYFATSALAVLPLVPLGLLDNIPVVMATLRQVISILPILLTILLLVHIQTEFKSYKSLFLLILLLSIPAVVQNNFWWHPDGLAILFAILVIIFLNRDQLEFGRNFYLAAVMCGFSAGTKGIGFYFFAAIFVYLLLGFFWKKIPLPKLLLAGSGFLACMGMAYLFANPTLVYAGVRKDFFAVMREQSVLLSSGYGIQYARGLSAAMPLLTEYYGSPFFLISILIIPILGIVMDRNRLLNIIILAWLLPISILVFWITHFKFQYWLPVALPLFSTVAGVLPETLSVPKSPRDFSLNRDGWKLLFLLIPLVVLVQMIAFINSDIHRFTDQLHRAEENESIQFYSLARQVLEPLPDEKISVYHDVRMYVPSTPNWKTSAVFKLLDYEFIQSRDFDVLLLMQQRINDYLNEGVQGVDPESLARSQIFYRDADEESLEGYRLVFRNRFGLIFVKTDLYRQYFAKN